MTDELSEVLGTREACALLRVKPPTLYRLVREQGLPCRKIGKPGSKHPTLLFSRVALLEWVRQGDGTGAAA